MRKQHWVVGGGGLRLHVVEWGVPHGRPVLFVHGWSQTYMTWLKQAESELAASCRLVAFDLRGHGLSEAPFEQGAYTQSALWAEDVRAVIAALGLIVPCSSAGPTAGWSSPTTCAPGEDAVAGVNFVGAAVRLDQAALGR